MPFDPARYHPTIAVILNANEGGERLMPLAGGSCCDPEAAKLLRAAGAAELFPDSVAPEAALSGMWLYLSCLEESHQVSQEIDTVEGSFWHGILHRQEPDAGNAAYWFRRVGRHAVFGDLLREASAIAARYPQANWTPGKNWDPFEFIDFCERARRRPGTQAERAALEMQRAEWQLLFAWCARGR